MVLLLAEIQLNRLSKTQFLSVTKMYLYVYKNCLRRTLLFLFLRNNLQIKKKINTRSLILCEPRRTYHRDFILKRGSICSPLQRCFLPSLQLLQSRNCQQTISLRPFPLFFLYYYFLQTILFQVKYNFSFHCWLR